LKVDYFVKLLRKYFLPWAIILNTWNYDRTITPRTKNFFWPIGKNIEKFAIFMGNFPNLKVADPTRATKRFLSRTHYYSVPSLFSFHLAIQKSILFNFLLIYCATLNHQFFYLHGQKHIYIAVGVRKETSAPLNFKTPFK